MQNIAKNDYLSLFHTISTYSTDGEQFTDEVFGTVDERHPLYVFLGVRLEGTGDEDHVLLKLGDVLADEMDDDRCRERTVSGVTYDERRFLHNCNHRDTKSTRNEHLGCW